MVEPATVGVLAASALAVASEAVVKGVVDGVVKDGYKALKDKVAHWAGHDVEALEKAPASAARLAVVAEVIDSQPADDKITVRALAEHLVAALKRVGGPVGLDVGRLDALGIQLGSINVTEGTGVRIGEARVLGTFNAGDINVGPPQGKS